MFFNPKNISIKWCLSFEGVKYRSVSVNILIKYKIKKFQLLIKTGMYGIFGQWFFC